MASFETHLTVTTAVVGVVTIPLLSSGIVDTNESVLLLFFGVIGGMLPHIDSDNSIPVKIAFKILSLILPLLILLKFAGDLPLLKIGLFWILASIGLYIVFTYGFLKLTVHRGIFHTIGMGLVLGESTALFMLHVLHSAEELAVLSGIYVTFGFLLHLLLDELYSVNLSNATLKRSFGTALKLYNKNNIFGSIVINILAVGLLFVLPDFEDVLHKIWTLLSNMAIF